MPYRIAAEDSAYRPVNVGHDGSRFATLYMACIVADVLSKRVPKELTINVLDSSGYVAYATKGKIE
jgi:hypothetical protein